MQIKPKELKLNENGTSEWKWLSIQNASLYTHVGAYVNVLTVLEPEQVTAATVLRWAW